MGYGIHITRRSDWFEDAGPPITLQEWRHLVAHDPEMRLDGYAEATTDAGATVRIEDPSMAVWTGYSGHEVEGNMAWMWLSHGSIVAKNPDEEVLRKMWSMAQALGAKVQGDDGEEYGPDGKQIHGSSSEPSTASGQRPWWRFW